MPGMRDRFAHFYAPDNAVIETAMKTGLVVPDANVLLNLYRFQATARDELFGALRKPGNRLWIPHQAGLEFQRNRLGVMKDQEGYFAKTRDEVLSAVGGLHGKVRAFGNRLGLGEEQTKEIDDAISALNDRIADVVVKAEGQNEVRLHDHASDDVLARVDVLFADDNSVGKQMEPKDLETARKEAERRVREKIPPGYKDRNKDDPTGDYLVWRQLLDEAKSRKLPVVFITDDSRSDDWYRREHGMTLGARHELREEMMREAGVALLMMTTRTFLLHAETHLGATVSKETVEQAEELPLVTGTPNYLVRINEQQSALADWLSSLSISGDSMSNFLVERIASGEMDGPEELRPIIQLLKSKLGSQETNLAVAKAVHTGQRSGTLNQEDVIAAMTELRWQHQPEHWTRTFPSPVNPTLPMQRDSFERALAVSPADDDPDGMAQARRIIQMNLERRNVTDDDRERASAWLQDYNERVNMGRSEPEGELPAED